MIIVESRVYRPNGDSYRVFLGFEAVSLQESIAMFQAFAGGYYTATGCNIGWDSDSSGNILFKIPEDVGKLAEFLKLKGYGCVQSNSS
jgi:hypothetical protein